MVTNNISEIRKEKHLSQDDLAVALGVCRKSIFNIEHNNVIPNIDTCLRLAKYLDMILSIMVYTFNSYKEDSYAAIGKAA